MWRDAPMNLHWQARAYNTFALSTLSYIWQLESPPQHVIEETRSGIFTVARSPGNSASVGDMLHLKEAFALPVSFRSVEWSATAAQMRVVLADKGMQCWRAMTNEHARLERKWSTSEHGCGCAFMCDWYGRVFLRRLFANRQEVDSKHGNPEHIRLSRLPEDARTDEDPLWPKEIQRTYYTLLQNSDAYDPVDRIRKKMFRLHLEDNRVNGQPIGTARDNTPAGRSERSYRNLLSLSRVCTPRVQVAVWGWLWNRWATARRCMQGQRSMCRLCRSHDSEDSAEHLWWCPLVRQLLTTLNLDPGTMLGRRAWALACPSINSVEKLALLGMAIYAANTVAARLRHAASLVLGDAEILQALRQCVKESTKGHAQAIRILREVWMTDRSTSGMPKTGVCARGSDSWQHPVAVAKSLRRKAIIGRPAKVGANLFLEGTRSFILPRKSQRKLTPLMKELAAAVSNEWSMHRSWVATHAVVRTRGVCADFCAPQHGPFIGWWAPACLRMAVASQAFAAVSQAWVRAAFFSLFGHMVIGPRLVTGRPGPVFALAHHSDLFAW